MIVKNLKEQIVDQRKRVTADVTWEDCRMPQRQIYFETEKEFADGLIVSPNAFLTACIIPAMYLGEKRLKIDGKICPILKEGIISNMMRFRHWFGEEYNIVGIEAEADVDVPFQGKQRNVGLFLSGGVDSLYTLQMNRLRFPHEHPASVKDGFIIHGFDMFHDEKSNPNLENFEIAVNALKEVAKDTNLNLIPVYTNIRHLYSDVSFWMKWYFGAALSAVGHAFSVRLYKTLIAGGFSIEEITPWGSIPEVDADYSSFHLQVVESDMRFRYEKIKKLGEWKTGLNNIRVCTKNQPGLLNCGKCEKCIRTMLMLEVAGKLEECKAFPVKEMTVELLREVVICSRTDYKIDYYRKMIEPLEQIGRADLVQIIKNETGLVGELKRFDRKWLGSSLQSAYRLGRNLKQSKGNKK